MKGAVPKGGGHERYSVPKMGATRPEGVCDVCTPGAAGGRPPVEGDRGLDRRLRRDRPLLAVAGRRDERGPDQLPALERRVVARAGSRREALPDRFGRHRPLRAQAPGRAGAERRRSGAIREFAGGLQGAGIAAVNSVETGPEQLAENERAQLVQVAFEGESADEPVKDAVKELRDEAAVLLAGSGLQAGLTGDAASVVDTEESFGSAETITFAATFVLILLLVGGIFRSPIARSCRSSTIGLVFLRRDLAGRAALRQVRLRGRQLAHLAADRRAVRDRHRLHPLPALPLSRAATRRATSRARRSLSPSAVSARRSPAPRCVVIIAFLACCCPSLGFFRSMAPGLAISVVVTLLAGLTLIPARRTARPAASLALEALADARPTARALQAARPRDRPPPRPVCARLRRRDARAGGAGVVFYTANYDHLELAARQTPSPRRRTQRHQARRSPPGAANPTDVYVSGSGASPAERADRASPSSSAGVDGVALGRRAGLAEAGTGARIGVNLTESADLERGARCRRRAAARHRPRLAPAGDEVASGGRQLGLRRHPLRASNATARRLPGRRTADRAVLGLLLRSVVAPLYLLLAVAARLRRHAWAPARPLPGRSAPSRG